MPTNYARPKYLARISIRIASSIAVLFLLITFIFFLVRIAPGKPTQKMVNPTIDPAVSENAVKILKLDKPLIDQYFNYIGKIISFDFGVSYNYKIPVDEVLAQPLKFTIVFSFISFLFQIIIGAWFALIAVKSKNRIVRAMLDQTSIFFYVLPSFVFGLILLYLFPVKLGIFYSSGLTSFNFEELTWSAKVWDLTGHLILPFILLTAGGAPVFYKYLKESMQSELRKNYVRYLISQGMDYKLILKKHVLPNAVIPVISIAGIALGLLFNGALITEYIFGLPGMGRLTYYAILSYDYPLVSAAALVSGTLVILCTLAADILKIFVDNKHIESAVN